jgi:hypothetical protein
MRLALAVLLSFGFALPLAAQTPDPAKLPARDSHQGILVACDPYQNPKRAKKIFGRENPVKAGILPVEVYIRNSTRWPVAVKLASIRLEIVLPGGNRDQLASLSADEAATAILHPRPVNPEAPRGRLPFPLPGGGEGGKWNKLHDKLQSLAFPTAVIAPGTTVHGFFYFNLGGQFAALPYSRFYVPDLKFLGNTQAIMFFEAPFAHAGAH